MLLAVVREGVASAVALLGGGAQPADGGGQRGSAPGLVASESAPIDAGTPAGGATAGAGADPLLPPPHPQAAFAKQSSVFGGTVPSELLDTVPSRAGMGIRRLPVDDGRGLLVS